MKEGCQMKWSMFLMLAIWTMGISAQEVSRHAATQVDSLILVSRDLTSSSDFDQALELNEAAEQIALSGQPGMGPESAAYGKCCFNKGRILHVRGDFQKAEDWYVKARSIQEKALGKEHPDYAWSLNNLAALYQGLGRYKEAITLHLEARTIREKTLGREHGDYIKSLNNLALLYQVLGRLEEAVSLLLEAISIQERTIGRDHPDFAVSLLNLAMDYVIMGQYDKIEPLYLEARSIQEKALGPDHPHLAVCLNDMGAFYERLGQYGKAEPLYRQALSIKEHTWGKLHPQYAISLLQLANLYTGQDKYELAEPLYLEAKSIREKAFGKLHPDYANSLYNLGIYYTRLNQNEKAETHFLEALSIQEHVLGKENPAYGWCLYYLADLNEKKGQYEKAESQFLAAAQIWKKALGEQHPHYAYALYRLVHLYEVQSRYTEAQAVLSEVLPLTQKRIAGGVSFLSEQELASFAFRQQSNTPVNAFLLARPADQTGELPALSYDQVLFEKGFLLQTASRLQALATATPEAAAIHADLQACRLRIARELARPGADRQGLNAIEEEANALEQQLSRTVAGYAAALRQVKWQEVQSVLPADAVALEFVHFQVNFPTQTGRVQYAAFLLYPGAPAPQFIPLCEESAFQQLLAANKERKADYVNELYAWNDRGLVEENTKSASLYALIWKQIEAAGLEGVRTVYYSPSGLLHRLNLGAIAVDDETILSDHYNLVALNSTRQLVIPSMVRVEANDAMLAGGVNFEADPGDQPIEEQELLASRSAATAWEEVGSRGGTWSYLKWTEKEVVNITSTLAEGEFKATQLSGSDATEEAIKAIGKKGSSPRILHIATHGFFFPDPAAVSSVRSAVGMDNEAVFKWSDNPMIRSGLILAGGNYAWQHGRAVSPDREDGILTAYEISQMNLANTELVVLSACETGLGDIQGNEGVYGLQRAFKIAGAKYLIMSLWQVPDRETMEFMTTFYKNWLSTDAEALAGKEEKRTIPDAFRKTQREMRDRFINPYSWAGFVLVE